MLDFDFSLDPFINFQSLYDEVHKQNLLEPQAMTLATVGKDKQPSARVVLFKGFVRGGFSFYTNYNSRKSQELLENSKAALTFFWPSLKTQIRVQGEAQKLTTEESDSYFKSRARLSQIGAWASEQSEKINDMTELEKKVIELEKKWMGQEIPRPHHWGGFHLIPNEFEFWFAREGRLHERYVYKKSDKNWQRYMLSP